MNFSNYPDPMDYSQPAPVPPPLREYHSSMDKTKIFWLTFLITIVISLIFVFGYWFGERKSSQVEFVPGDTVNLADPFNQNQQGQLPSPALDSSDSIRSGINTQPPSSYLDKPLSKKADSISSEELNMLDSATLDQKPMPSNSLPDVQTLPSIPPSAISNAPATSSKEMIIRPQSEPKAVEKPKETVSSPFYYTIQIATLKSEEGALRLKKELSQKGINATILKKGVLYRVRYGQFDSYAKANKVAPSVKDKAKVKDTLILKIKK